MTDPEFREALLGTLGDIRHAIDALSTAMAPPQDEPPHEEEVATCPHPADARIDFSGQGTEEWECRICGHRELPKTVGAQV